jgi:hypothetical protein
LKVKENFGKKMRVITTSCLNICPTNKLALVIASKNSLEVFKTFVVAPEISVNEIYTKIF